jgi:acetyl-CoA decarbonylase/synthase complex subunit gamma
MALSGIEIFKLLPKTNCQECGVPTCMAFAVKLAAGQAELDSCPYVSDEAREKLEEASAPPIRPVVVGSGDDALKVGGETVIFRHEKTFVNKPGLGLLITDAMDDGEAESKLKKFKALEYERVGLMLKADIVAIKDTSGDADKFAKLVEKVKGMGLTSLVLMSDKVDVLKAGVKVASDCKPLIYAATAETVEDLGKLALEAKCPIAVKGNGLEEVASLTAKLTEMKIKDIVVDTGARKLNKAFQDHIELRRAALVDKIRPLGFPTIVFPCEMTDDPIYESVIASTFITKYGGILILSEIEGHNLFPLTVQRMNIYTDPQRPMATSEGICNGPWPHRKGFMRLTTPTKILRCLLPATFPSPTLSFPVKWNRAGSPPGFLSRIQRGYLFLLPGLLESLLRMLLRPLLKRAVLKVRSSTGR